MIQLKANQAANIVNWGLLILIAIGATVSLLIDNEVVFSLARVTIFGTLFIGIRNLIELIAIKYYEKQR